MWINHDIYTIIIFVLWWNQSLSLSLVWWVNLVLIYIYHKSCFVVRLSKSNKYHNCLKSVLVFSNIIVWWSQAAVICLSSLSCPAQHIQSHTLSYRTFGYICVNCTQPLVYLYSSKCLTSYSYLMYRYQYVDVKVSLNCLVCCKTAETDNYSFSDFFP